MGAPVTAESESESVESGVAKFLERCVRIGVRRSSSSRRGSARAVSCTILVSDDRNAVRLESWYLKPFV